MLMRCVAGVASQAAVISNTSSSANLLLESFLANFLIAYCNGSMIIELFFTSIWQIDRSD
jgi:hypothetical protein